jgi:hypothetical protein
MQDFADAKPNFDELPLTGSHNIVMCNPPTPPQKGKFIYYLIYKIIMVSKHSTFSILAILIVGIILISGCVSNQIDQPKKVSDSTEEETENIDEETEDSECTSPYDGTYSGLVSGSGEMSRSIDGEEVVTPYIITYSLEVTFECGDYGGFSELCPEQPGQKCWNLAVTHAKVSDPFFGCTNGCTPEWTSYFEAPIPGEGGGKLVIDFPNPSGAWLHVGLISIDSDAKTIRVDQLDRERLLQSNLGNNREPSNFKIETVTFRCPECAINQEGFTMTLDKIS